MVTQETRITGGQTYVTTNSYDSTTGEMNGMACPGGLALMHGRDANGRVEQIASGAAVVVRDVKYMPFGPVTEMTFGDGVLTASANERYLPTRIQAGPVMDYQYTEYTGSGEVKAVTGVLLPDLTAGSTSYTPVSDSNRMTGHTYDGAGNMLTEKDPLGNVTTYTYEQGNKTSETVWRTVDGVLTALKTTYEYDGKNRPEKVTNSHSSESVTASLRRTTGFPEKEKKALQDQIRKHIGNHPNLKNKTDLFYNPFRASVLLSPHG